MSYLDVYNQIKSLESIFTPPVDYVTIDVGTFDAATGAFSGLITTTETDPEPLQHGPNQKPTNPKPHFVGATWVSITIDSHWRQTITSVPAPKVGLAPVLLKFSVANHGGASWTLHVAGKTVTVPTGQSSTTINIWDLTIVSWTVSFGSKSHTDQIRIQRSTDKLVGAGAFTIPALPLSIVYAPPADAASQSKATYAVAQSVGTTSSFQFSSDSSTSHPALPPLLDNLKGMQDALKTLSDVLALAPDADLKTVGKVLGTISSGIGTISGSDTTGTVSVDGTSITVTQTNSQTIMAETKNGGPGAGDTIHYLRDAKFAWLVADGRLKIALLGGIYSSFPASFLKAHASDSNATGLPPDVVQQLLAMDPFVSGGGMVTLASDRFEDIDAEVQGPFEYGGGQTLSGAYSQTFTTTETHSHNAYTTHTQDFQPGWLAKLFGATASGLKTTVSMTQAAGTTHSETQSINWELHSGTNDRFVVEIWRDRIFGTYAFRQEPVVSSPRVQGLAKDSNGKPLPNQRIKLTIQGKTYSTMSDQAGHFAFFARNLPAGSASLLVANQPAQTVSIAAL